MLFRPLLAATVLHALAAVAVPTWSAFEEYEHSLPKSVSKHQGTRPKVDIGPKKPYSPFPSSPARNRDCYVKSHNDGVTDDSPYILEAIDKCNNGGHVIFPQGTSYVIGTALNLTYLNHIDLGMLGKVPILGNCANFFRYPRLYPIHQRYRLLASKCFLSNVPKCDNFLPARRQRCQCLWWWLPRRQWPGVVRSLRREHLHSPSSSLWHHWSAHWYHSRPQSALQPSILVRLFLSIANLGGVRVGSRLPVTDNHSQQLRRQQYQRALQQHLDRRLQHVKQHGKEHRWLGHVP